jgi:hypothetical protein
MTFSVGVEKAGAFEADGSKTVADPREFMKRLDERSAHLFFGGGVQYTQFRLLVGPAAAAAIATETAPEERRAAGPAGNPGGGTAGATGDAQSPAGGKVVPLGRNLPPLFSAAETYSAPQGGGIIPKKGTYILTRAADFLDKDKEYVFDVWVQIEKTGEPAVVGIGDGRFENSLGLLLRPTEDRQHHGAHLIHGDQWGQDIVDVREPGVYIIRVERHAGAMTFSIGPEKDGKFEADGSTTIADPKGFMPKLSERSAHLFFGGGVLFLKFQLTTGPAAAAISPPDIAKPPPTGRPGRRR